jgi:hypothetical protein
MSLMQMTYAPRPPPPPLSHTHSTLIRQLMSRGVTSGQEQISYFSKSSFLWKSQGSYLFRSVTNQKGSVGILRRRFPFTEVV